MAVIGISGKIGSGKDTVGSIIQYLTTSKEFQNSNSYEEFKYYVQTGEFHHTTHAWQIKKFAKKLKQIASILTGIPVKDLEKQEVKDRVLGDEWGMNHRFEKNGESIEDSDWVKHTMSVPTVRWLLQTIGTEAMRNCIHENVWVNALFADYVFTVTKVLKEKRTFGAVTGRTEEGEYPNWIITDIRFPNELKAVEDRGGITIRINRPYVLDSRTKKPIESNKQYVFSETTASTHNHPSETALDDAQFKYTIDNNGTIEELIEKVREILIKEDIIKS
jgi:hypothetical protein